MVRLLLQRVVVWAPASSPAVRVQLHWTGGTVTEHQIRRAVRRWEQVADAAAVWQRVQDWQAAGWTSRRMAEALNAAGHRTPRGRPFTAESVRQWLARGGPSPSPAAALRIAASPNPPIRTPRAEPGGSTRAEAADCGWPRRDLAGACALKGQPFIKYARDDTQNPSKSL